MNAFKERKQVNLIKILSLDNSAGCMQNGANIRFQND